MQRQHQTLLAWVCGWGLGLGVLKHSCEYINTLVWGRSAGRHSRHGAAVTAA